MNTNLNALCSRLSALNHATEETEDLILEKIVPPCRIQLNSTYHRFPIGTEFEVVAIEYDQDYGPRVGCYVIENNEPSTIQQYAVFFKVTDVLFL